MKLDYEIFEVSPTTRFSVDYDLKILRGAKRILDLGCGKGDDVRRHRFSSEVVSIDVSKSCCVQTKRKNKVETICSDAEKLPFISNSFDGVLSNQVIEHVNDDKEFLKEVRRVLKDRGKLVISTAKYSSIRFFIIRHWGIMRAFKGRYLDSGHLREYSFKEFFNLLHQSSFDILEFKGTSIGVIAGYLDSALWALAWKLNLRKQADKILSFIYHFNSLPLPFWQTFSIACINRKNIKQGRSSDPIAETDGFT
jgi:SAM-dependent methyltransferase